jgi:hypothetical protein
MLDRPEPWEFIHHCPARPVALCRLSRVPPSWEVLSGRLSNRGTEDPAGLAHRLRIARRERSRQMLDDHPRPLPLAERPHVSASLEHSARGVTMAAGHHDHTKINTCS